MNEIPLEYRESVNTYESIYYEGFWLSPIRVREHEAFQMARPAIDFMQQSLPVRYISMPLLSAYYAMDVENKGKGLSAYGLFTKAILFLVLALRFKPELDYEKRIAEMMSRLLVSADNPTMLTGILIEQGGVDRKLTPIQFQRMRPILAAQNGIKLESTDANPDIVETERVLSEMNGPEMDYDINSLISSVAAFGMTEEKDIYDWPMLKLTRRREAYDRLFSHLIYGFAVASGAKFKGGNPVPSAFFDRIDRESTALVEMSSVTGGGTVSISEQGPNQEESPNNKN